MSVSERSTQLDLALMEPGVPETLLGPVFDTAADVLRGMEPEEVPASLKPLAGFDRRGLARSTARQQISKALFSDTGFRDAVVRAFLDRPEVASALRSWKPEQAVSTVVDALTRDDLPLVASALWAGRPHGWEYGLGAAVAASEVARRDQAERDDAAAIRTEIDTLEEARRRADVQRRAAEDQLARVERELKEERRSRRSREEEAAREARAAEARADQLAAALERERASAEANRERATAEAEKARNLDRERRELRTELDVAEATILELEAKLDRAPEPGTGLRKADLQALADAAELAQRLANGLGGVVRAAHKGMAQAEAAAARQANEPAVVDAVIEDVDDDAPARRTEVVIPPGLPDDDPAAIEAMLRTPNVMVVVDGYNVSMAAWPDLSAAIQRDRLINALAELHARMRCAVSLVFDGADVQGVPAPRRPGVHVVFSDADEDADHVVVEGVRSLPPEIPVVVVSSDKWVRDESIKAGARVVRSDALLRVLH